jgi:hypothetical protein
MFSMIIIIAFINGTVLLPVILSFVGAGTIATHAHMDSANMESRPSAEHILAEDKGGKAEGKEHVGKQEFFQLTGPDGEGLNESLTTFHV